MNNLIQDFNEIKSSVEQTASDFVSDIERLLESGNQTTDNILKTKTINQTNQQILFTRQQMFQSLVELNSYKQKIIYLLICVIILIFIAFGLVMYMRRGSAGNSVNAGRFNRLNRA
jgi:lipopolysaccharide export LptBFGC system permease protein LptF